MFTVCPKCALTLVVTAADLRVAQGYVRCGRCSNVFNALARLSEDRNATANAATQPSPTQQGTPSPPAPQAAVPNGAQQKPAQADTAQVSAPAARTSAPSPTQPCLPQPTPSHTYTAPPLSPNASERVPVPTSAPRPAQPPVPAQARATQPTPQSPQAHRPVQQPSAPAARTPTPSLAVPPPAPAGHIDLDDEIPEHALEFNPAATNVDQVFVEPPPNPEWTAATGTFKALVFKEEDEEPEEDPAPDQEPESPTAQPDNEIELDADFLSSTAVMRKLKSGLPEPETAPQRHAAASTGTNTTTAREQPTHEAPPAPPSRPVVEPTRTAPPANRPTPPQRTSSPASDTPQVHAFLSETQSQTKLRPPTGETQTQALLRASAPEPQVRVPPLDEDDELATARAAAQGQKTVRAFGLDTVEPPPSSAPQEQRLASLARSRVAPAPAVEIEPATRAFAVPPASWGVGAGLLVIFLVGQMVHHYRNDLAATPRFNKPITALYAALGMKLTPHWDLRAYDVRQLGASVDAESAGQIMVRASVKNGGRQAQPMPLLRVTLQDRFGNRIAARDVSPGSYLPRAIPAASFLSAGQRIDAEMAFVDPGANAVGFEIDACLPAAGGGISCANDAVAR
jgi:predicted Zn finger-like uncharacterized protein